MAVIVAVAHFQSSGKELCQDKLTKLVKIFLYDLV